ncbi:hypothetical protein PROFFT_A_05640 [Candidatus Profftia tarda]|uniref:Uncharacterized protein n=1 Tax=Candidatus Profftia tarda TaxID=1177216 RepID=A0A8E4F0H9_9ENTR|nr:hypothetical protein PROFFT_A_05640 [Candidatus Profftia tarda]
MATIIAKLKQHILNLSYGNTGDYVSLQINHLSNRRSLVYIYNFIYLTSTYIIFERILFSEQIAIVISCSSVLLLRFYPYLYEAFFVKNT